MPRTCDMRSSAPHEYILDVNLPSSPWINFWREYISGMNTFERMGFWLSCVILIFIHVLLPSTRKICKYRSVNIDSSVGIKMFYAFLKRLCHLQKASHFQTMILQRAFFRLDVDDKSVHRYTRLKVVHQLLCHLFTLNMTTHRGVNYNLLMASPKSNLYDVCTNLPWKKRCYILRIVWNYLPGDTASHSKQHVPLKITRLKKVPSSCFFQYSHGIH